jgi:hypothetical protein
VSASTKVTRIIHVTNPKQARDFLRSLRGPDGQEVTHVYMADGRKLALDEAPDQAVLDFAHEMIRAIGKANQIGGAS